MLSWMLLASNDSGRPVREALNTPWFAVAVALPFLVYVVAVIVIDAVRRRRAPAELERVAAHFGLKPDTGDHPFHGMPEGDLGARIGRVDGVWVRVTPDDLVKVRLRLGRTLACELGTAPPLAPPRQGLVPFAFGSALWNDLFKTRHASPEVAAWLTAQGRPDSQLARFVARWSAEVRHRPANNACLSLVGAELACSPRRGGDAKNPSARRQNFFTFEQAAALIPDLVALAKQLEAEAPGPGADARPPPRQGLEFEAR